MIDGTNRHSGLGRDNTSRTRYRQNTKKAGRFPIRDDEGPAKNLLLRRRKNAQQDTKTLWSLAGFSNSVAKDVKSNLAGFHRLLLK